MQNDSYITPAWPAPKNVRAISTTRLGGVSKTPYESFNLGTHVGDDLEKVNANRQKLIAELNLPALPFWLTQIHGNRAICLDDNPEDNKADAAFTTKANKICIVQTADCLPILLCDKQGTTVAAIHAGWRGLANNIIENTIASMNVSGENLLAWLGPAISQQAYEVSLEVKQNFQNYDAAFIKKPNDKCLMSLNKIANIKLSNLGISNITDSKLCTFTDQIRLFSHRRDSGITGRMVHLIWIEQ